MMLSGMKYADVQESEWRIPLHLRGIALLPLASPEIKCISAYSWNA
jgi:hypothetical protein